MPLDTVKDAIHQRVNELCAVAAVDEMAGDMQAYREKLQPALPENYSVKKPASP